METWKKIPGLKYYEASSLGRIRSLPRTCLRERMGKTHKMKLQGKIISPGDNGRGYLFFYAFPRKKRLYVHRAVLAAFTGKMLKLDSNHKNGSKGTNRVRNLEWTTSSHNQRHSISTGLRKLKLSEEDVRAIRAFYVPDPRGPNGTTSILAKIFRCGRKTIRQVGNLSRYSHIP